MMVSEISQQLQPGQNVSGVYNNYEYSSQNLQGLIIFTLDFAPNDLPVFELSDSCFYRAGRGNSYFMLKDSAVDSGNIHSFTPYTCLHAFIYPMTRVYLFPAYSYNYSHL